MATLNLQVNALSYKDTKASNNPSIRVFDYVFKLPGQTAEKPQSDDLSIAPGETRTIFNGSRATAIDGTTAFSVTRPDPSLLTYRFSHTAGTAPVFRTDRLPGIDNTSQFSVSVNGPIATYTNTGGQALNTGNVVVGDVFKIDSGAGFSSSNSGRFTILAKTSNSISVQNLSAVLESITIADFTKFLVYSNGGSNNQIQLKDKVIISAGFSLATQGTYEISEVTPSYFEISSAAPSGIPLESGIIPGASGLIFYSSAKKFVLISAQQKCSVRVNADSSDNSLIEPVEANNPEKPGIYLKNGTVYSLVIKNLSLETMNLIVATAE